MLHATPGRVLRPVFSLSMVMPRLSKCAAAVMVSVHPLRPGMERFMACVVHIATMRVAGVRATETGHSSINNTRSYYFGLRVHEPSSLSTTVGLHLSPTVEHTYRVYACYSNALTTCRKCVELKHQFPSPPDCEEDSPSLGLVFYDQAKYPAVRNAVQTAHSISVFKAFFPGCCLL